MVSGDVPAQLQAQVSGPVHITVLSPPTVFVAGIVTSSMCSLPSATNT